ncbi:hypothetical protein NUU61_001186 [Penicillium alfredii]|uniref:Uncharacterized protein n=1 Tax=Penicillium alfredii TaxID=1506179 RepID=A0A9W9KRM0_9EURO|nr:uncharacterized protein NUU61_001186 [Penicillium alfredii]KAJ5115427.1 hypothetical protein NUU61_001186 [Penicillium alfredii]
MTQLPPESVGWMEMSFFLIQTESCRLLHPVLGTREQCSAQTLPDIAAKRKMIQERTQYVSSRYGISSSSKMPNHLPRIAMQHSITAYKKMEFMLQLREKISMQKQEDFQDDDVADVLNPSFKLACDGLESSYCLALLQHQALASRSAQQTTTSSDIQAPLERRPASPGFGLGEDPHETEIPLPYTTPHEGSLPNFEAILEQGFLADTSQNIFSSLDLSVSEVPFLPEWNAVINGSLIDGNYSNAR